MSEVPLSITELEQLNQKFKAVLNQALTATSPAQSSALTLEAKALKANLEHQIEIFKQSKDIHELNLRKDIAKEKGFMFVGPFSPNRIAKFIKRKINHLTLDCGFVDDYGDIKFHIQGDVTDFTEGTALISHKIMPKVPLVDGSGYRFINSLFQNIETSGRIIKAHPFSNGLAPVQFENQFTWDYINKAGTKTIDGGQCFLYARPFSEEIAWVDLIPSHYTKSHLLVDIKGNLIKYLPELSGITDFSEGVSTIRKVQNQLWVYVDKYGEIVSRLGSHYSAHPFAEGLALVTDLILPDKVKFINHQGEQAISETFDNAYSFSEGLAPVKQGLLWTYINKQGEKSLEKDFLHATPFEAGLAKVNDAGKFYFIDRYGNKVFNDPLSYE